MRTVHLVACLLMLVPSLVHGDPSVLPTPPCAGPCPLICFQITDVVDLGNDNWRFEFEVLNWTQFHDPSLTNRCVGPLTGVNSDGAAATGLALVRAAGLSQAQFFPVDTDPNGAPMSTSNTELTGNLTVLPNGELGLAPGCAYGFIAGINSVTLTTPGGPASTCASLEDCVTVGGTPQDPWLIFSNDGPCAGFFVQDDEVTVSLELHDTVQADRCDARLNDWRATQCSTNQLVWRRGLAHGDTSIPAGESVKTPCPTSCEDKDAGDNVLDGFVIEVRDFKIGERLVFNWYLLDDSGPIAAGSPPTATTSGSLAASPKDPLGFSYGSFQINRVASCASGDCATTIMLNPPVENPAVTCLVDRDLDRNSLPFDFFVSMLNAGPSPDCGVEETLVEDAFGIQRLMLRATPDQASDRMVLTFEALDNPDTFEVQLETADLPAGRSYFELNPDALTDTTGTVHALTGRYRVSGACLEGALNFNLVDPLEVAVPQQGDKATVAGGSDAAFELDPAGQYTGTGLLPAALPALGPNLRYRHILQVRDLDQNATHVVVTEEGTDLSTSTEGRYFKPGTGAPTLTQVCRYPGCSDAIVLGTNHDGGDDCAVEVAVTVAAENDAGSFRLSNDFDNAVVPSYAAYGNGVAEAAQQTVFDSFEVGPPTNLTFTAVDHTGNIATRVISVQVVDDTPPKVRCSLVPQDEPPGGGNGGGRGGGNGNAGGGCSNRFQIVFDGTDNCDVPTLVGASIDGIDLMAAFNGQVLGKIVTILKKDNLAAAEIMAGTPNEDLRMQTPGGGVLSITYSDTAGNTTTRLSTQSLPTVVPSLQQATGHAPTMPNRMELATPNP